MAAGGHLPKHFLLSSEIPGGKKACLRSFESCPACSSGTRLKCDPAGLGLLSPANGDFWPTWTCVLCLQPKGADRKQKTDREKMEKRTAQEKEKYQPSYETTILTEVSQG